MAWCVTNQTLFNSSERWQNSDGSKIGWEECEESCYVEDQRDCNEISMFQFPFNYEGFSFTACTTFERDHQSWCITNETKYYARSTDDNLKPIGWTICSNKCPLEHKVCKECQFPFIYEGVSYDNCIEHYSALTDPLTQNKIPWCVINKTLFYSNEEYLSLIHI